MSDAGGRVFLSHASEDKDAAWEICSLLEAHGVPCWFAPRDIAPGADWPASIAGAIETCRAMLILLTPAANRSTHMNREVQLADRRKIPVIPVRLEDLGPAGALEYFLGNRQWLDLFPGPVAQHKDALLNLVRTHVPGKVAPGPPPRESGTPPEVNLGPEIRDKGRSRRWPWFALAGAAVAALITWLVLRPPVIEVVDASPRVVEPGAEVRLSWRVHNARRVDLVSDLPGDGQPGDARVVPAIGELVLVPQENMVYSLRASGWTRSVEVLFPVKVGPVQERPGPQKPDVVRLPEALPGDGIPGYRIAAVEPQPEGTDHQWVCNLEIDYTYDKGHHPVSVVGGVVIGEHLRTLRWGFWGTRGDEIDAGPIKRGTRRVSMAIQVMGEEARSRELHLFIAQGDPPGEPFYIRKFPFIRVWKRP